MQVAPLFGQVTLSWICLGMAALVGLLFARRSYRLFPAFFAFSAVTLLQAVTLLVIGRIGSLDSLAIKYFEGLSQLTLVVVQTGAVFELSRNLLARFRGVWGLCYRVLLASAVLVVLCTLIFGTLRLNFTIALAHLAAELALAVVIVLLLLFVRYYQIPAPNPSPSIATGLCFYSSVLALRDAIFQSHLEQYLSFWNDIEALALLLCLVLWINAFCGTLLPRPNAAVALQPATYFEFAPEINSRLRLLNQQLAHFWKIQPKRP